VIVWMFGVAVGLLGWIVVDRLRNSVAVWGWICEIRRRGKRCERGR
jgi:hypothetical protein